MYVLSRLLPDVPSFIILIGIPRDLQGVRGEGVGGGGGGGDSEGVSEGEGESHKIIPSYSRRSFRTLLKGS